MSRASLQIFVHAVCCAKIKNADCDPVKELAKHDEPPPPPDDTDTSTDA